MKFDIRALRAGIVLVFAASLAACGGDSPGGPHADEPWQLVARDGAEALLAVGGRSSTDVFAVGADRGRGPLVLHYDGAAWSRVDTGHRGDLWWVFAVPGGKVLMGGAAATVLEYDGSAFTRMKTPGLARHTIYGIWGRSPNDVYAVGSLSGRSGFVWHFDGSEWRDLPLPLDELPRTADGDIPGFFKVSGDANDVWIVGARGVILRSHGGGPLERIASGTDTRLLTIDAAGGRVAAVGGEGSGALVELGDGGTFVDHAPEACPLLQGIALASDGRGVAVGMSGIVLERKGGSWERVNHRLSVEAESLHAVWGDEKGGIWAVGGNVLTSRLDGGVLLHRGSGLPAVPEALLKLPKQPDGPATCPAAAIDPAPGGSIARRWNEQILGAIRRDLPQPGVHARNLFHLSAAIWDAWAAYDPAADGVFFVEKQIADDVVADRQEAISHAAFGVLSHRYRRAIGGDTSLACFRSFMEKLGYDPDDTRVEGDSPASVGNRIAAAIIAAGADDGANEANAYADTTGFKSVNPPLVVDDPGATLVDPSVWQPLDLAVSLTQNGILNSAGPQKYIGANWGLVTPFAMTREAGSATYHDPGPAPVFGPELRDHAVELIRLSAELGDEERIDLSPGSMGNNTLGQNDGHGRALNPATGQPYPTQSVARGDFGRVLAEFWADGPRSETPPGHWNVIANAVADSPGFSRRLGGEGLVLDPLEWDVKVYLALNGAVHDAAIAAWELKRAYLTVRPISLVRYMGGLGQSTDSAGPAFHADGLPLIPGLIEVVTKESSAPGERHAKLARFVGQVAIRSWRGEPGDRVHEVGGSGWIRAVDWMPYQLRTFVTPAFPGFISGHSTFSRAAAEVLVGVTGSEFFPGGLGEFVARPGYLTFEEGPSTEVRLQWATYYDAADQAGRSRLWGGIHVSPDDVAGRLVGHRVGLGALAHAEEFFEGRAVR
ncbi:vanadium-dependent haloperoxidase [Vulgatibacter incomptus]|uniref:DUF6851 domain-containing protein n=1 Tax=Vulgatibacter incomptus TaxID=1391653 RepID=A0A0K1PFV9_9BACT|nr:vanadium-dependent haloperoxidase [Vulgatibacter incomptus]AKU92392.1 hypothetical protein AKJ08_2779 [Vulgatibacter incomptus]